MPAPVPYWRLSGFYFFYFSVVGALVPYWGLYLQALGYSAQAIGVISAILMATRIIAPNLWGWLGDRTGQRLRIIQLGSLLACVSFAGLFLDKSVAWVAFIVALYAFFWNAVLPQFEVITLGHLGDQPQRYSLIRLWGSVGFIVAVLGLGLVFDQMSIAYLPSFLASLLGLIWLSSLVIPNWQATSAPTQRGAGLARTLKQKPVICFLAATFLLQLSHGPYYTFYSLYLDAYGYSRSSTGALWALGVVAEVLIFFVMHRILPAFGARQLLLLSMAAGVLRWWLIACYADSVAVLIFAQLLHAFTFGVFHAVAIEYVRRFFSDRHQSQGQALYSAVGFGAGGALGAVLSGLLWDVSKVLTFALAAAAAALALWVAWHGLDRGGEIANLNADR